MSDITFENLPEWEARVNADNPSVDGHPAPQWQSASKTDIGRVRPLNEDALLDSSEQGLWVVADGMGGHSRGDYASNAVVKKLLQFERQESLAANLQDLRDKLLEVNEQCRTAFRDKRPGTTVAAMLAHGRHCFFLWAGDSRIYRVRENTLQLLTQDHTVAQQKHARGELTKEEKRRHATSHVLTRAVGVHRSLELELGHSEALPGDRFLICSDGLYNLLEREEIRTGMMTGTPEEACDGLVASALQNGGRDNITVIIIQPDAL